MLTLCSALFFAMLLGCLVTGQKVTWAILGGLILFCFYGKKQGFSSRQLWEMARPELKKAFMVLIIIFLIGIITGLLRASGTIAYCIVMGMELVTPKLFLVIAFLLSAALSYVLGTSFGVSSTMGVILMALARSGGVDPTITAGVILSGVYFGDRCSPASSAASLVAAVTDTQLYSNVRQMFRTGLLPTLITLVVYTILSFSHPITAVDASLLEALTDTFSISWTALLPALIMFLLPLFQVPIRRTMLCSIACAAVIALTVQGFSPFEVLSIAVNGYHPENPALSSVLSGGGILSMMDSYVIVTLTSSYCGILTGTGVLTPLRQKAAALSERIGHFGAMVVVSSLCISVLCNQVVSVMLGTQLLRSAYDNNDEMAQDIENSGIMIAGLIPWSIASSVPLSMLGSDLHSIPYAVLLWCTPLCYSFTKRFFYPRRVNV
ncbi:MAG: hypothetical protein IJ955_05045 [Oscillospiraceae bacterium]|nr:hypothetical protein [Oscillospiraceae bacterium]